MRQADNHIRTDVGHMTQRFALRLACRAVLSFGCLLGMNCSNNTDGQGNTGNTLSCYTLIWSYEAPLFWGYWGKSEDALCFANQAADTLDILDRRTGALLRSVPVPFSEIHCDRNRPILVQGSAAHLFTSTYSDECKTVNMLTGRVASNKVAPLGTIDASGQESAVVSDGKLSYQNKATNVQWALPFRKEGFSLLSHTRTIVAARNVYVATEVYEGRIKPGDLLPGGYVTGKPVGFTLSAYRKLNGDFLWRLPVESRLYFCAEADSAVLVNSSNLHTFGAHAVDTGRELWQRELSGARFSTIDGNMAVFLEQNAVRVIDLLTGRELGRLAFPHDVTAIAFDAAKPNATTPALYWSDAVVVCEEAKDKNGKPILRLHCYGKRHASSS